MKSGNGRETRVSKNKSSKKSGIFIGLAALVILLAGISAYYLSVKGTIEKWNDKLDSIAAEYMDSPFFGALVVIVVFIFGCWAISYLTKK